MSPLAAKVLIIGIPLLLSVSWFLYWVLKLASAARRLKPGQDSRKKSP